MSPLHAPRRRFIVPLLTAGAVLVCAGGVVGAAAAEHVGPFHASLSPADSTSDVTTPTDSSAPSSDVAATTDPAAPSTDAAPPTTEAAPVITPDPAPAVDPTTDPAPDPTTDPPAATSAPAPQTALVPPPVPGGSAGVPGSGGSSGGGGGSAPSGDPRPTPPDCATGQPVWVGDQWVCTGV